MIVAVEEFPVEQLDADHGEDEEEEEIHDEDVEDVLERDHDAVEHGFERRHSVDHLEGPQHTQQLHRLQFRSSRSPPEVDNTSLD